MRLSVLIGDTLDVPEFCIYVKVSLVANEAADFLITYRRPQPVHDASQ